MPTSTRWPPRGPVLLTGATGFLGMQLLARYLLRTERRIVALVRAADDDEAAARIDESIATMLPDPAAYAGRVEAVAADVTRPGLGLSSRRLSLMAETVNEIVHAAASVSFSLSLSESREINVEGTRRMLDLAELCQRRGGLRRFAYVSTAYVAGDRRGTFEEHQLDLGQSFRNPYEHSKFEAEGLVRERSGVLPIQIFRPSIVVGEHDTGWTPAFNVIYGPLRAFGSGAYAAVPARLDAPVDVVPVDYVADAIFEATGQPHGVGETYHLAAGDAAATVGELVERSAAYFGRRRPLAIPPGLYRRVVHPLMVAFSRPPRRTALRRSEVFFPYFAMRVHYDTANATSRLGPTGVAVPPLSDYFERLLDYAHRARWGKASLTRPELMASAGGRADTRIAPHVAPAEPVGAQQAH